jgi:hypothetical protein
LCSRELTGKEGERTPTSTVTKEGESATPQLNVDDDNTLHPCSKEGEQMANLVLIGEDMGSPSSTDGLKVTMKYTGGRGIKVDNYTDIEYQTIPMSRDAYLRIALAHAEAGNESKFNMFFKAAKLIGHVQNLKEKYPASVCKEIPTTGATTVVQSKIPMTGATNGSLI